MFLEAFQMQCPGCVSRGLPQAVRLAETFSRNDVVALDLHTVCEHHEAQVICKALAVFLHDYRIEFPLGIDQAGVDGPLPKTMAAYVMQGTPTAPIVDREGRLCKQMFGRPSDLAPGADSMASLAETSRELPIDGMETTHPSSCDADGCAL